MASSPSQPNPPPARARARTIVAAVILVGLVLAAYANSFAVPLQFDDGFAIGSNPTIRHWSSALFPPAGTTVGGRPILNLSLALNYALGGEALGGYHALNLLIHLATAFALWGIVARTLHGLGRSEDQSTRLGFAVALLWAVHPLQTESVTYLSQRAESLMGLFYLGGLYGFIRGCSSATPRAWWTLAVGCCFLGMGTKEVMVSAPVVILLYDRTFLAGSFRAAWRLRRGVYLGLASSWVPLAYLVASAGGNRGGSTGFGIGVNWIHYLATQAPALLRYLGLIVWPSPLVFEYGPVPLRSFLDYLPQAILIGGLLALTGWAVLRRSPWGFAGTWFFAILAPTSLVPGALQMIAEHRVYLASVAVIAALVVGFDWAVRRGSHEPRWGLVATATGTLAVALAGLTFQRNRTYQTPLALWSDTVAKRPNHALAHYNLANELAKFPGTINEAIREYRVTLDLQPRMAAAHYNLGVIFEGMPDRTTDTIAEYRAAVAIEPNYLEAENNLGSALARAGRPSAAIVSLERAHQLAPGSAVISKNLGSLYFMTGRMDEALRVYEASAAIEPNDPQTQSFLAATLERLGRYTEARQHQQLAARLSVDH